MHIFIISIRIFDAGVHLCRSSTSYHSHALPEKPFEMSRMPTFGTDESLSILYLPFVLSALSSGGKNISAEPRLAYKPPRRENGIIPV